MNRFVMSHSRDIAVKLSNNTIRYTIPKYFESESNLVNPLVEINKNSIVITFKSPEQVLSRPAESSYENPWIETERTGESEKSSPLYRLS